MVTGLIPAALVAATPVTRLGEHVTVETPDFAQDGMRSSAASFVAGVPQGLLALQCRRLRRVRTDMLD